MRRFRYFYTVFFSIILLSSTVTMVAPPAYADTYIGPSHGVPPTVEYNSDNRKMPRHPGTESIDVVPITLSFTSGVKGPDESGNYVATSGDIMLSGSVGTSNPAQVGEVKLYKYTGNGNTTEPVGKPTNVNYEFKFSMNLGDSSSWSVGDHRYLMYAVYNSQSGPSPHPGKYTYFTITKPDPSDTAPLGPPTKLVATAGNTEVSLSWAEPVGTGGEGINDYMIFYSLSSVSDWTEYEPSVTSAAPSATVTGLTNGNEYRFAVKAVTASGTSDLSEPVIATPATVPSAPVELTATAAITDSRIDLSWQAPRSDGGSPVTGYDIQRKTGSGDFANVITTTTPNTLSYSDTGLSPHTIYAYKVSAVNKMGPGASNSATATTAKAVLYTHPYGTPDTRATSVSPTTANPITLNGISGTDLADGQGSIYNVKSGNIVINGTVQSDDASPLSDVTKVRLLRYASSTSDGTYLVEETKDINKNTGVFKIDLGDPSSWDAGSYRYVMHALVDIDEGGIKPGINTYFTIIKPESADANSGSAAASASPPRVQGNLSDSNARDVSFLEINGKPYLVVPIQVSSDTLLYTLDVTDPFAPLRSAPLSLEDPGGSMFISTETVGGTPYAAYRSYSSNLVGLVDLSNPDVPVRHNPVTVGAAPSGAHDYGIVDADFASIGSKDYLAAVSAPDSALHLLDMTDPASLSVVGSLELEVPGSGNSVVPSGLRVTEVGSTPYAVVVSDGNGDANDTLHVIDISDPANPSLTGSIAATDVPGIKHPNHIEVTTVGNIPYAVIVSGQGVIRILDLSDPASPAVKGSINVMREYGLAPDRGYGLADLATFVVGDKTFVAATGATKATNSGYAFLVDVTNPEKPVLVGTTSHGNPLSINNPKALTAVEIGPVTYVAVASNDGGIVLAAVSNDPPVIDSVSADSVLSGTGMPGVKIAIESDRLAGGSKIAVSDPVDSAGSWKVDLSAHSLGPGIHKMTAVSEDAFGRSERSVQKDIRIPSTIPSHSAVLAAGLVAHDENSAAGLLCRPDGDDGDASSHVYKPWHTRLGQKDTHPETFTYPFDVSISPSGTENRYDVSFRLSEAAHKQMHAADGTTLKDGTKIILKVRDIATGYTHRVYNVDLTQDYDQGTRTVDTEIDTTLADFKVSAKVFGQSAKVQEKFHYPGGTRTSTITPSVSSSGSDLTLTVHHGLDSTGIPVTSVYSSSSSAGSNPVTHVSDRNIGRLAPVSGMSVNDITKVKFFQTASPVMCLVSEKSFSYYSDTAPDVTVDAKNPGDPAKHYGTGVLCSGPDTLNTKSSDSSHHYPWIDSEKSASDDYVTPLGFSIAPRSGNDGIYDISFRLPANDSKNGANLLEQLVAKDNKLVLKLKNPNRLADTYQVFEVPHGHVNLDDTSLNYGLVTTSIATDLKYFDLAVRIYGQSTDVKSKEDLGIRYTITPDEGFVARYTILKTGGELILADIPYDGLRKLFDKDASAHSGLAIKDHTSTYRSTEYIYPHVMLLREQSFNIHKYTHSEIGHGSLERNGVPTPVSIDRLHLKDGNPMSCLVSEKSLIKRYSPASSPPTGLKVAPGTGQAELEWDAPPAVTGVSQTGYKIEYSSDSGATWSTAEDDDEKTPTAATVTGLASGKEYVFRVSAKFSGVSEFAGSPSAAVAATTPATVPGIPTELYGAASNAKVELFWHAPENDGGRPITDYRVEFSSDSGSTWTVFDDGIGTGTTAIVTGLTNGKAYPFRVSAINSVGASPTSATNTYTPVTTAPDPPTGLAAVSGDAEVRLSWSAPADDGGRTIERYTIEYSTDGSSWDYSFALNNAGTTYTVTGLINDREYHFRVYAINSVSHGHPSEVVTETPAVIPDTTPPVITFEVIGTSGVTILYLEKGASPAPMRGVTAADDVDGDLTASVTHDFADIVDMDKLGKYTVTYSATDAAGNTATKTRGVEVVTANIMKYQDVFKAHFADLEHKTDGNKIYAAIMAIASGISSIAHSASIQANAAYNAAAVAARSDVAAANDSLKSPQDVEKIREPAIKMYRQNIDHDQQFAASINSADKRLVDSYRDASEKVKSLLDAHNAFDHSSLDGNAREMAALQAAFNDANTDLGDKNEAFLASPSGQTLVELQRSLIALNTSSHDLTEKADEVIIASGQYQAEVTEPLRQARAAVAAYDSAEAALQAIVDSAPGAPTGLSATAGNAEVTLAWAAPTSTGSSPIDDYVIRYTGDGSEWIPFADGTGTGTTETVTGLTNGQQYSFRVSAANSVGEGPASVVSETPRTVPDAPTGLSATAGSTEVHLSWTAPADTGGAAITDYTVQHRLSSSSGSWTSSSAGAGDTAHTVTDLTNGQQYSFRVSATNSAGTGDPSDTMTSTPVVPSGRTPPAVVSDTTPPVITLNGDNPFYVTLYNQFNDPGATAVDDVDGTVNAVMTGHVNIKSIGTYTVTYTATDAAGNAATAERTVEVYFKPPRPPTILSAVAGDSQVTLTWPTAPDGNSPLTGYIISYKVKGTSVWSTAVTGPVLAHTVKGLINGDTYQFKMSAKTLHYPDGNIESSLVEATPVAATVPGAPTGLTPTAGNTHVGLSWAAPADTGGAAITDYVIEYSADGGSTWAVFADGTSPGITATVTGLTNDRQYSFRVSATNSAGNGNPSDVVTATPVTTAPGAPTGLSATAGSMQVELTWTAPSDTGGALITDYKVEHSSDAGSTWAVFADGTSPGITATVTGLTNGQAYSFRVSATNSEGTGVPSDAVTETPAATAPGKPTGLTPTAGSTRVELTWAAPSDTGGAPITDYKVEHSSDAGSTWAVFADGTGTGTTATVTGLTNGQEYRFRVSATNSAGTGVPSDAATGTPVASAASPPASFDLPSDIVAPVLITDDGRLIYVYDFQNGRVTAFATDGTVDGSGGFGTVLPSQEGAEINNRVRMTYDDGYFLFLEPIPGSDPVVTAFRADGSRVDEDDIPSKYDVTFMNSKPMTETSFGGYVFTLDTAQKKVNAAAIPPSVTVPGAPTGLGATAGDRQVELTWAAPADTGGSPITDYVIEYSRDGGSFWTVFADGTSPGITATVTGLTNGQAYSFRVSATNPAGTGVPSAAVPSTPPVTVPGAPTGLAATSGSTLVTLTWTAPDSGGAAITDYIIEYSADAGSSWATFADGTGAGITATVTGLTNDQEYRFRVSATNSEGTGDPSDAATGTPAAPAVPSGGDGSPPDATADTPASDVPSGLVALAGDGKVQLNWAVPAVGADAVSDYRIFYRLGSSAADWTEHEPGVTSTAPSATVTSLTNGQAYSFHVRTVTEGGDSSDPSDAVTGTPAASAASTPASFDLPSDIVAPVLITDDGRLIYVYDFQNGRVTAFATDGTVDGSGGFGTVPPSQEGAEINNRVRMTYDDGYFLFLEPIPGSDPVVTAFRADGSRVNEDDIPSKYDATFMNSKPMTETSFGGYVFTLDTAQKKVNAAAIPPPSVTVPGAPTGLTPTAGDRQVQLSWTAPADTGGSPITDYTVQHRLSSSSGSWTSSSAGAGDTAHTVTGLTNGQQYSFMVLAVNSEGAGVPSAAVTETPSAPSGRTQPATTVPDAPTGLAAVPANTRVGLTWTAPDDGGATITDYIIEYSADAGSSWTVFADGTGTAITATVTGLTNGQAYSFRVSATNSEGDSDASAAVTSTPVTTVPDAPTGLAAVPANTRVGLTWAAPDSGGAAITDYIIEYSADAGSSWTVFADGTGTAITATVTGLTNGQAYSFRVSATNSEGDSDASDVVTGTPVTTVPDAPTGLAAVPANTRVGLTWAAPDSGGATITDYIIEYSADAGSSWTVFADGTGTAITATVTGLTNGQAYSFRVSATNSEGDSDASDVVTGTPVTTVPDAPTGLAAVPANTRVGLTWAAPDSGGAAITDYIIEYSADAGSSWTVFADGTGTAITATVTGLTNGQAYSFRVSATNSEGDSDASDVVTGTPVTTVPDAPTGLAAVPANTRVGLTWAAPDSGGAAITDYIIEYSADAGSSWTVFADGTGTAITATVTGLTNGQAYSFRVSATNSEGDSDASDVVTGTPVTTVPDAPTGLAAVPANTRVGLTWAAPDSGGAAITDYIIEYSADVGSSWTVFADGTGAAITATVTGLTNGQAYSFRVSATNSEGDSDASDVVTGTPVTTVPDAPTGLAAVPANTRVGLTWTAPDSGGATITDYIIEYSADAGSSWTVFADGTGTAITATVTGLTNGQAYSFRVSATNSEGDSDASDVVTGTPVTTVPDAPTGLAAVPANTRVGLTWTAPDSGGATITDYIIEYSADAGSSWTVFADGTGTAITATVTGLTNGQAYSFRVSATNSEGDSDASDVVTGTPVTTAPDKPTGLTPTAGRTEVTLTWAAPANTGGPPITDYKVEYSADAGSTWATFADGTGAGITAVVTGLTGGQQYSFRVSAINSIDTGVPSDVAVGMLDTTPPVITLNGQSSYYVSQTSIDPYVELGATAQDDVDGSVAVVITGSVDRGIIAHYTVTYTATDSAGNAATAQRTVKVANNSFLPVTRTTTPGDTEVTLTWSISDGGSPVVNHKVHYREKGAASWTPINVDGSARTHTVTGLTNGVTYEFKISFNTEYDSFNSESRTPSEATPHIPPGAPANLKAKAVPGGDVRLDWDSPANKGDPPLDDYKVEYSADGGSTWAEFAHAKSGTMNITVTGLTAGQQYSFRVSAVTPAVTGPPSNVASELFGVSKPGSPVIASIVPGDRQAVVTWTPPSDTGGKPITSYRIAYSADDSAEWKETTVTDTATTSVTISGLDNGKRYTFALYANNGFGDASSLPRTETPRTVPDAPSGLTASRDNAEVRLSWTAPADDGGSPITDYIIQYRADGGSTWATFADGTGTGTTATVDGLTNGQEYRFKVRAANVAGDGPFSNAVTATPKADAPGAPTGLAAVPGNTQVALTWLAPSSTGGAPITDYVIQYSADGGSSWITFDDGTGAGPAATVDGLTNGQEYRFMVIALNYADGGVPSDAATATPRTVPNVPSGLAATPGDSRISLKWAPPGDTGGLPITGYVIEYKGDGDSEWTALTMRASGDTVNKAAGSTGTWSVLRDGGTGERGVMIEGLANGREYSFRVSAVTSAGTGGASATVAQTPSKAPGIPILAAAPGNSEVTLAWEAPDDGGSPITGYEVHYRLKGASDWEHDLVGIVTSHAVDGLTNGETYEFAIAVGTARFGINANPLSETVEATPDGTPPVIRLVGPNPYYIRANDAYVEHGYAVTDDLDGDPAVRTFLMGLDTAAAGPYFVTYVATDAVGNESSVTRDVHVYEPVRRDGGAVEPVGSHGYGSQGDRPDEHRIGSVSYGAAPASEQASPGTFELPTNYELITVTVTGRVADHNADVDGTSPNDDIRSVRAYQFVNSDADLAYLGSFAVDEIDGSFEVPLRGGDGRGLDSGEHRFRAYAWVTTSANDYAGAYYDFAVAISDGPRPAIGQIDGSDSARAPAITVTGADGTTAVSSGGTIEVASDDITLTGTMTPAGELVLRDSEMGYVRHILPAGNAAVTDWRQAISGLQPGDNTFYLEARSSADSSVKGDPFEIVIRSGQTQVAPVITVTGADGTTPLGTGSTIEVASDSIILTGTMTPAGELVLRDSESDYVRHILPAGNAAVTDWRQAISGLQPGDNTFYLEARSSADSSVKGDPFEIVIRSGQTQVAPVITVTGADGTTPLGTGSTIEVASDSIILTGTMTPAGELVLRDSESDYVRHILPAGNAAVTDWRQAISGLQPGDNTFYLEARSSADSSVKGDPFEIVIRSNQS